MSISFSPRIEGNAFEDQALPEDPDTFLHSTQQKIDALQLQINTLNKSDRPRKIMAMLIKPPAVLSGITLGGAGVALAIQGGLLLAYGIAIVVLAISLLAITFFCLSQSKETVQKYKQYKNEMAVQQHLQKNLKLDSKFRDCLRGYELSNENFISLYPTQWEELINSYQKRSFDKTCEKFKLSKRPAWL